MLGSNVTDRQTEEQKMKNSISLKKQGLVGGCFPISQCLPPPSNDDNIFFIYIGVPNFYIICVFIYTFMLKTALFQCSI